MATITGNATAGQVSVGNGADTVFSYSDLVWKSASSRMGICVSDPSVPLHVYGNYTSPVRLETTDGTSYLLQALNKTYSANWANAFGIYQNNSGGGMLNSAGNAFLYWDSAGDLGLGTSSPGGRLDIQKTVNNSKSQLLNLYATVSDDSTVVYGQKTVLSQPAGRTNSFTYGVHVTNTIAGTSGHNTGIRVIVTGGSYAYAAEIDANVSGAYENTGVYSSAYGANGKNYGLFSNASGGTTNYGIYTSSSGGTDNWGIYVNSADKNYIHGTLEVSSTIKTNHGKAYDFSGYTAGAPTADGYLTIYVDGLTFHVLCDKVT